MNDSNRRNKRSTKATIDDWNLKVSNVSEEAYQKIMHVSINDVIDSDNEEFFDAISETWSPNNSMKSFEESKKVNF